MRREDIERLRAPYTAADLADAARLSKRLHVEVPRTQELVGEFLADLDDVKLGIGWWAPAPGTRRRILISDQLLQCATSIQANFLEARVHLMEAAHAAEDRDRMMVGAVTSTNRRIRFELPRPRSALDDLVLVRFEMHVVGCVRALASALDCLGATIVGVLALPTPILTAGYRGAKREAKKNTRDAFQLRHWTEIEKRISAAGPASWDDWVLGFRNMLVHRGRRTSFTKVQPAGATIVLPDGSESHASRAVSVLPSDPDRSDVEVMRDASPAGLVLTEDAFDTLEGALRSTLFAVEETASGLRSAWSERRSGAWRIPQPDRQWPDIDTTGGDEFVGYRPGSMPFDPTEFRTDATLLKRLKAASLDDSARGRWATYD